MTDEEIRYAIHFIENPYRLDTIRKYMKIVEQGDGVVEERLKEIHDSAHSFSETYIATAIEETLLVVQKIYNENGGEF